jgi:hypothetical protein
MQRLVIRMRMAEVARRSNRAPSEISVLMDPLMANIAQHDAIVGMRKPSMLRVSGIAALIWNDVMCVLDKVCEVLSALSA